MLLDRTFEERRIAAFIDSNHDHYLFDLLSIRKALDRYYIEHLSYPKNKSFDGVQSCWGESTPNWIPDLAPKYIEKLPNINHKNSNCGNQYLYKSNGKGYKLIVHFPEDCEEIKRDFPSLIDPNRDCFAYGYWNDDGKNL